MKRSYKELSKLKSFEERFKYLKLDGVVGHDTFGSKRYLNQEIYRSKKWRSVRDKVIERDDGCDLGLEGHDIFKPDIIIVHHINPLTIEQIINNDPCIYDMDNLISSRTRTHDGIHFGDENAIPQPYTPRSKNDTCPWK